jgi:hypothetical protein
MKNALFIGAGGGGDAISSFMLSKYYKFDQKYFASISWDRKSYDPTPGPRNIDEFKDIEHFGELNAKITPKSRLKLPNSTSFLPKISESIKNDIFLLELKNGVNGLVSQINELVKMLDISAVFAVDVGGDILAAGTEPHLFSPISDVSFLAALSQLDVESAIIAAGLGLDGELAPFEINWNLMLISSQVKRRLKLDGNVAQSCLKFFTWHPSEVNGIFVSSALGIRGKCMIGGENVVKITDNSPIAFEIDATALSKISKICDEILETTSLDEIEAGCKKITGKSELDYERVATKNIKNSCAEAANFAEIAAKVMEYSNDKAAQGIDFLTIRAIEKFSNLSCEKFVEFKEYLCENYPNHYFPPIWACTEESIKNCKKCFNS